MRALVTCQPGLGHLHPLIPLARALSRAETEVVFAVSRSFRHYVQGAGFPVVPIGLDWLESEMDRCFPDLSDAMTHAEGVERAWQSAFSRSAARLVPELISLLSVMRPHVVVSESTELSGSLAAEVVGIPRALLGIGPRLPWPVLVELYGAAWNNARARFGLTADPHMERYYDLYLDAYPPSMQPLPQDDRVGHYHQARPVPYEIGRGSNLPWLAHLGDEPLIYVTMGTVFNRVAGAFEPIIEALGPADGWNILVTVGANGELLVDSPSGRLRVERYVPMSTVIERVDVVVSHGGYNTSMAALSHGKPLLCLPLGADQHYNAFRIAAAGAGIVLDPGTAAPDVIRQAVRALLDNPLYAANARRIGDEIASMPSMEAAAAVIVELGQRSCP